MIGVLPAYAGYFALSGAVFFLLAPRPAILVVFLGGWLLLPVGVYPESVGEAGWPWWITGIPVPSEMLVTKGWITAVTALVWALLRDPGRARALRPLLLDVPVVLWCLWPLLTAGAGHDPAPALASAYLFGVWGAPWLLGRIWFADAEGRIWLLRGMALSALACLPLALAEGVAPAWIYGVLYEPHPFRFDGVERPVGFRPIGMFEHGNQYGLWVGLGVVAAVWLALAGAPLRSGRAARWGLAVGCLALLVAAQSRGALVLAALGLGLVWLRRGRALGPLLAVAGGVVVLAVGLHVSGVLPLQRIARDTELGRAVLSAMGDLGMGTFSWRIGQDVRTLGLIWEAPLAGSGRWDWSHVEGTRPWGLWLLLAGQFGLVGAGLALAALLLPALRGWRAAGPGAPATVLAIVVLLAVADGWLNAWLHAPALLAAGSIATPRPQPAGRRTADHPTQAR